MCRKPFILVVCAAAVGLCSSAEAKRSVHIKKVSSDVYEIYDPETKKTAFVRDPEAYIRYKFGDGDVKGFGSKISEKKFAKGTDPVGQTVEAAANGAGFVADTAYNVTNTIPSWRKYTAPVKALFGGKSKKSQR